MASEEIVYEGYLVKSPPVQKIWKVWRRRWFVLRRNKFLEYYKDKKQDLIKTIDLRSCLSIDVNMYHRRYKNVFSINTAERSFFLVADNKEIMHLWQHHLCKVCDLEKLETDDKSNTNGTSRKSGVMSKYEHLAVPVAKPSCRASDPGLGAHSFTNSYNDKASTLQGSPGNLSRAASKHNRAISAQEFDTYFTEKMQHSDSEEEKRDSGISDSSGDIHNASNNLSDECDSAKPTPIPASRKRDNNNDIYQLPVGTPVEVYDVPPPTGKEGITPSRDRTSQVSASPEKDVAPVPPRPNREAKHRATESSEIYDVPPPLDPHCDKNANLTYDVPPERRHAPMDAPPDQIYDTPPSGVGNEIYDVPPVNNSVYDTPPGRYPSENEIYDVPPGREDVYDVPPNPHFQTRDDLYDTPPTLRRDHHQQKEEPPQRPKKNYPSQASSPAAPPRPPKTETRGGEYYNELPTPIPTNRSGGEYYNEVPAPIPSNRTGGEYYNEVPPLTLSNRRSATPQEFYDTVPAPRRSGQTAPPRPKKDIQREERLSQPCYDELPAPIKCDWSEIQPLPTVTMDKPYVNLPNSDPAAGCCYENLDPPPGAHAAVSPPRPPKHSSDSPLQPQQGQELLYNNIIPGQDNEFKPYQNWDPKLGAVITEELASSQGHPSYSMYYETLPKVDRRSQQDLPPKIDRQTKSSGKKTEVHPYENYPAPSGRTRSVKKAHSFGSVDVMDKLPYQDFEYCDMEAYTNGRPRHGSLNQDMEDYEQMTPPVHSISTIRYGSCSRRNEEVYEDLQSPEGDRADDFYMNVDPHTKKPKHVPTVVMKDERLDHSGRGLNYTEVTLIQNASSPPPVQQVPTRVGRGSNYTYIDENMSKALKETKIGVNKEYRRKESEPSLNQQ